MRQPIEQCGGRLGIAECGRPCGKAQAGLFVQLAQEVK